jgi:PEP-CTERM motif-containing protein
MSDFSRALRVAALTLALSLTATLAQATTITYSGDPTPLGTLSTSTPTDFADYALPPGAFSDFWTFTLPSGSTGGTGSVGGVSLFIGSSPSLLNLSVSIPTLSVTDSGGVFSFSGGTPGGTYTLDISGTVAYGAVAGLYGGTILAVAVPEPATWALMLAGIAVGAGVARRRLS